MDKALNGIEDICSYRDSKDKRIHRTLNLIQKTKHNITNTKTNIIICFLDIQRV